jgi:hypothetical protein
MKLEDIKKMAAGLPKREICAEGGKLYLERYLIHGWSPAVGKDAEPGVSVYLHHIVLPDQDDVHVLHNHPWGWAESLILHGWYVEERQRDGQPLFRSLLEGMTNRLESNTFHRITDVSDECWTLFMVGPKTQSWGFTVPGRGFTPWRDRLQERGITPDY